MDKVLAFLVEHGGWGSIGFLLAGWACVLLWHRNNALQDDRAKLSEEIERQREDIKALQGLLDGAVKQAAQDRQEMLNRLSR